MKSRAAFLVLLLIAVPAVLAESPDPRLADARQAYADRDYARGVALYRQVLEETGTGEVAEECAMMIVRGLSLAGDHEAVVRSGEAVLFRFQGSPYRDKVAFLTARSLLHLGRGEDSDELMSAALDRLRGPAARARIAAYYLKAGDRAFQGEESEGPFDKGTPPDYTRALRLYGLARETGIPPKLRPGVLARMARAAVETKAFDLALDVLDEIEAARPETDPTARALLLRGRAMLGKGERPAAVDALERLVALHPRADEAPEALLLLDDHTHLERLVRAYPEHPAAARASYRAGELLVTDGRIGLAVAAFDRTVERFPGAPEAQESALAAADALFAVERFEEAQSRYDAFLRRWPESSKWARARTRLTEAWYRRGEEHLREGRADSAAGIWAALRSTYPLSDLAPKSLFEEASFRKGEEALARYRELIARYPASAQAPDAAYGIARIYAGEKGRVTETVAALNRVIDEYPQSQAADRARARLKSMREEALALTLPAPLGTDRSPGLEIQTRNLKRLTGRAWRIDPVAYFRKHGSLGGIEDVMVEVVAPDVTFTHGVSGYEEFRSIGGRLPVPVTGAGAWIVVVEGGKLRATGLLLVSEVTVLTKESPAGVLAFVQRAGGGEPVGGAEVIARDGAGEVRTAVTGDDGVAELAFENPGAVSVLAREGDSVAFTGFDAASRRRVGLESVVHVSTDRSLYRPGDTVRYRLVARRTAGERRVTPSGAPYSVLVKDKAGNVLEKSGGTLSEFGTADGEFALPADAPPDTYRIAVTFDERSFTGDVVVQAYRKPQVFLGIEPEKPVFIRGEEVRFAVTARYAFGRPMPGLPVSVRAIRGVGSGQENVISGVVRTDAEGRAELAVPTLPGPDMAIDVRAVAADVTGRFYRASATIPVPATGYAATLEAARERVFTGEEIRVALKTTDLLGNPVAAEGRIQIARGRSPQNLADVATVPVTVDESGKTEVVWSPEDEGYHRLRFVGTDRRGNEVIAAVFVRVFSTGDRLVVRADRGRYRVGDEATVEVAGGRGEWALLTCEGEDVYRHRVVELPTERTTLTLPVTPDLYPDVRICVSLIRGGALRGGEERVFVDQEIRVSVEPGAKKYGPGELARVTVKTTDLAGRPVPAEVSVAVVDEGIYRLRADDTPDLVATFRPPERQHLVRTASSASFSAVGVTARISEDLIAERERRKNDEIAAGRILAEESLEKKSEDAPFAGPSTNRAIGIGGGAGGGFGGRGGRRNLRAGGGGGAEGLFEPRSEFRDTAFWRAAVTTGAKGEATVEFTLPDDMTEWRVTARAVSHGNAFGEGIGSFLTARPLVIRSALPRFLREGDEVVAAAGVVNGTGDEIVADVTLDPARGGKVRESLSIPDGREAAVDWPLAKATMGTTKYTARVGTPTLAEDAEVREIETIPFGVRWKTGVAGVSTEAGTRTLDLPADAVPGTTRLTLTVAPTLLRAALDGVEELRRFPYGCTEQTVNRFYPALEAANAIRELGLDRAKALPGLTRVARAGALRLTYLQNPEGLWGWWERGGTNAEMTAWALIGLARAKAAGVEFSEAVLGKAAKALPGLVSRTGDPDTRAFLHYASSLAFGVDFERLAPAYADRARLGTAGLAWLALAYEPAGRVSQREVLLGMLEDRIGAGDAPGTEALAWALVALAGDDPASARTRSLATGLVRRRQGAGFGSTRETGAAVVGLARVSAAGTASAATRVSVSVNGEELVLGTLGDGPLAGRAFEIPADRLSAGENRIGVTGSGGVFHYALTLRCVRREAPAPTGPYTLSRQVTLVPEPDPFGTRARESIVRAGTIAKESPVETVRAGEVVRFRLRLTRRSAERYLVVEEPLASGFEPIPGSEKGPFSEAVRHDDRFVFFLENAPEEVEITFLARSEAPGRVRIPPGIAWAMYRPGAAAWSGENALAVVPRGTAIDRDPTLGLDPTDLLSGARKAASGQRWARATEFLRALLDRYELTDGAKTEALRLLAEVRLAAGSPDDAVEAYRRLRSELPGAGRELEDELLLARAYRQLSRHGDAVSAMESATGILFARDRRVPETIGRDEVPEFLPALLDRYPFAPYTEAARLDLVNRSATAYEEALARDREPDPGALVAARDFLARYPGSAAAPEVHFRFARLHLRAGRYEEVERAGRRFADRYPDHPLRADADWFVALSLFAQERYEEADAAARASLEIEYPRADGDRGPTTYRANLLHLRAQVAHVQGHLDEALALYRRVESLSPDAREAIRLLTEEVFEVTPVTRVRPGEPAVIGVSGKNVDTFDIGLYPVDILVYFALSKDVSAMSGLNLDGLAASVTKSGNLGFERRRREVRMDLGTLDPGVYLVIGRVEDREERGIVIVSDLDARIHRHPDGVRVVVTDRATGEGVSAAYVKLAADGEIVGQGRTDPRGYFEVQGNISGRLSAVAKKGERAALAGD